jgi:hypothetical protein
MLGTLESQSISALGTGTSSLASGSGEEDAFGSFLSKRRSTVGNASDFFRRIDLIENKTNNLNAPLLTKSLAPLANKIKHVRYEVPGVKADSFYFC